MDPVWISLLAALGGALIGSATSLITILVQNSRDERQHRHEFAMALAIQDRKESLEQAAKVGRATVAPIAVYMAYYLELSKAMSAGPLTVETLRRLRKENGELMLALKNGEKELDHLKHG